MKLFFRIIFKMFLILTILAGCATTEQIEETDPIALVNQGKIFDKEGQYDRAIAYFSKAIELNPRYTWAYYNRGNAYADKGQYDKAISDYSKAIEISPRYAYAYYNRGNAYADKDQYDKAISDFNKAIELNPRYAYAYYIRGNAYADKGQYDKAISDYSKAIEINPRYAYAYYNRGNAYADKDQYDKAISDYSKAIEINPTYAKAYHNRGNAYADKDQYDKAISDYSKAIEINPTYAKAYNNRGVAYGKKGQHDKATADYNKAIEINPSYAETDNNRRHSRLEENTFFCDNPKLEVRFLKNISRKKEQSSQGQGYRRTTHAYITDNGEMFGITIWRFVPMSRSEWQSSDEQIIRILGMVPLGPIRINNKTWFKYADFRGEKYVAFGYFKRMDMNIVAVYCLNKNEKYKDEIASFKKTRVMTEEYKQVITEAFDYIEQMAVIE